MEILPILLGSLPMIIHSCSWFGIMIDIKNQKGFEFCLDSNREIAQKLLCNSSSYKLADRPKIIRMNKIKPIRHVAFREYENYRIGWWFWVEKHGLGPQSQRAYGISFDVVLASKSMFTLVAKKVSSIHEIKIGRRTEFQYFLLGTKEPDF